MSWTGSRSSQRCVVTTASAGLLTRKKQQTAIEGPAHIATPPHSTDLSCRRHAVHQVPCLPFSASPWHRHQLTGSFVCANCAAPMSLCVVYSIHGLVALLLRFSVVIGGAVEPPAAHTFERARLWHPHDVPPTCSSLLDRGAQDVICGPILSLCFGLQRRGSMPPHGLDMACTW